MIASPRCQQHTWISAHLAVWYCLARATNERQVRKQLRAALPMCLLNTKGQVRSSQFGEQEAVCLTNM